MFKILYRHLFIGIVAFLSFCGLTVRHGRAAIPAAERAALIALYNSTDGDNWTNNSGWKEQPLDVDEFAMPGTENTWYGVTTDVENTNVTQINLSNNQLTGSIPSELGNLSHLTYLSLDWNQLTGSIPSEIGELSNLKNLILHRNKLSGDIPAEMGNLANLQEIILEFNQLTGTIPIQLGNLANLINLDLQGNLLTGNIPAELGDLTHLEGLDLRQNRLTGNIPTELANLSSLEGLVLTFNQLTGEIPAELGNLSSLLGLRLDNNQLSGSIPAELGNLANLELLELFSNQLTGSIPSELGSLANLEWLDLSNNQLSGMIPSELGNLSNLLVLKLHDNKLRGMIPLELMNLTTLWDNFSDICGNHLFTTNDDLRNFLNIKQIGGDWESCQTDLESFETGDLSAFPWRTGDSSGGIWSVQASTAHSGNFAAQAPVALGDSESRYLSVTLCTERDMDISFWFKVSSEPDHDVLKFKIDGIQQERWSGEIEWRRVSYPVSAGRHRFAWAYSKDDSISKGSDTAWVDDIEFPPTEPCKDESMFYVIPNRKDGAAVIYLE